MENIGHSTSTLLRIFASCSIAVKVKLSVGEKREDAQKKQRL